MNILRITATTLLTLAVLATPTAASATRPTARQTGATALRCRVTTDPGHPVTFSPDLTLQPRTTRVSGAFRLTDCTSPDGTHSQVRSGTAMVQGTGRASCSGASDVTGSGTVTWYDRSGHHAGTSTLRPALRSANSYNPGDSLLAGNVTHGLLAGTRAAGSITPTSNVSMCARSGLRSLLGAGTLRFLR
ncbi:hypothetical protein Q3V23_34320 [Streptomyces sp. VNUA116]|uniref:hypothetical protein n=1 Tax=Streptomyces sp. VNUA116 TaxID=3062449 RepID=UPI0026769A77|nr:hypothetical protein [Streptomyces sp. VNUA116]WKU48737.1 hypothetical protein Q3V23_34320 [Streptomyces sp. VNUA116]